ncbi:MAG: helicase [Candidatus Electrothrix sp. AR3]|nr:helicase [Candidatus Electrothrix sp. AR3]
MQIKIFTIPILGGEQINEDLNHFLNTKKILQTESHLISNTEGSFWCFCIKYLSDNQQSSPKKKIDYRAVLDSSSFQRFSLMREIRKKLAREQGIPAYAIFTDVELAELAKIEHRTFAAMQEIKGIGSGKLEKYGKHFTEQRNNEKNR